MMIFTRRELKCILAVTLVIVVATIIGVIVLGKDELAEAKNSINLPIIDKRITDKNNNRVLSLHEISHRESVLLANTITPGINIRVRALYLENDGTYFYRTVLAGSMSKKEGPENSGLALVQYQTTHALTDDADVVASQKAGKNPIIVKMILSWTRQDQDWSLIDEDADGKWDYLIKSDVDFVVDEDGNIGLSSIFGKDIQEDHITFADAEAMW